MAEAAVFKGTERFEIVRRLGAGGMGVVYAARDRERGVEVALKTLRALDAGALLRFKHEFRALADLRHPNLVGLGDLMAEGGTWFFTMELVTGVDFLAWARPGADDPSRSGADDSASLPEAVTVIAQPDPRASVLPEAPRGRLDERRLRGALAGLMEGLRALHDARMVHRDVKPSNVIVTAEGRVVLVDFGLVAPLLDPDHAHGVLAGTVAYMAPEQATGGPVSPAADMYAVGVMLYEALTGRLPFHGSSFEVLANKRKGAPDPPEAFAPDAPRDLCALCIELLRPDPAGRPSAADVLTRLGVRRAASIAPPSAQLDAPFVGREREIEQLRRAWAVSREGGAVTVYVHGESGVGKTALVRTFVAAVTAPDPEAVLLAGRCYERESVPYKAVDGVIDALSRLLSRLPRAEAQALLPRNAARLGQVFPVLAHHTKGATPTPEPKDAAELRAQVFAALRDLLVRVARRFHVVVVIDDLQWADPDSLQLLRDLMTPPDAPPLLLVCTVRTRTTGESARSVQIPTSRLNVGAGAMLGDVRDISLGRLGRSEALELAAQIARRVGLSEGATAAIAEEAAGHPLFIDELARHAAIAGGPAKVVLDDALWARIRAQDDRAQALVRAVCLAGTPLPSAAAMVACGFPNASAFDDAVAWLRTHHLVRSTLRRGRACVEPYHDRVRLAVLGQLGEGKREEHGRIARALEAIEGAERELLANQWLGAGDRAKAAHYAFEAADSAAAMLAFDRAARLYAWGLDLDPPPPERAREIERRRGDALVSAGRGQEAGRAYLAAARHASPADAIDLERKAAEQLLMGGAIDEGVTVLKGVLERVGMSLPATPARAYASLVFQRARLKLRGLSFKERRAADIPRADLQKVDACWTVSTGLGLVDTVRAADFQLRAVLLALSIGEPLRVARALATEAAYVAGTGAPRSGWAPLVARARSIADRLGDPYAQALATGAEGMCCYDVGEFRRARALCEEAAATFRDRCPGTAWEMDTARMFSLRSLYLLGEMATLLEELPAHLRDAENRGDLYLATNLRTGSLNLAWLVVDDPDDARAQLDEARARWSTQGVHLQHLQEMHARATIDLYEGADEAALRRVEAIWDDLERAQLMRIANPRVFVSYTRGRTSVAVARRRPAPERERLLRRAIADAAEMARTGLDWALGLASLLRGSIADVQGDAARARARFDAAARELGACEMGLFAAIARRRRGEAAGGDAGRADVEEADAWMRGQAIVRPDRIAYAHAP